MKLAVRLAALKQITSSPKIVISDVGLLKTAILGEDSDI